jgi:hypothetical protein
MGVLDMADPPHPKGMLITDGKVSPFINGLIDEVRPLDVSTHVSSDDPLAPFA